jgi:hypothetical protein
MNTHKANALRKNIRRVVSAYVTRDDTRQYLHQQMPSVLSMLATLALFGAFHTSYFLPSLSTDKMSTRGYR